MFKFETTNKTSNPDCGGKESIWHRFAIAPFSVKTDWLTSAASQREGESES